MRTLATVAATTLTYYFVVEMESLLLFRFGKLDDPNWRALQSTFILILVGTVIWFTPLRTRFPTRLTWSWSLLLPLSFLPINLWFSSIQRLVSLQPLGALILWKFSTSVLEELGFRGFAFLSFKANTNPKLTALLSSFIPCAIDLTLLVNDQDRDVKTFSLIVLYTFTINLCYGIARTITKSLAWITIIAVATQISLLFVTFTITFSQVSYAITGLNLFVCLVVLFLHPAMKSSGMNQLESVDGRELTLEPK